MFLVSWWITFDDFAANQILCLVSATIALRDAFNKAKRMNESEKRKFIDKERELKLYQKEEREY